MTAVYRYYDRGGALLYVGIADDWCDRMKGHRFTDWFQLADSVSVEHHPDRESAAAAELTAIRTEWPLYNIHASPWKTGWWLARQREARERNRRLFANGRKLVGAAYESWRESMHRRVAEGIAHEHRLISTAEHRLPARIRSLIPPAPTAGRAET